MEDQNLGYELRIGSYYNYYEDESSIALPCQLTNIIHDGHYVVYEITSLLSNSGVGATIYPNKLTPL